MKGQQAAREGLKSPSLHESEHALLAAGQLGCSRPEKLRLTRWNRLIPSHQRDVEILFRKAGLESTDL